MSSSTQAMLSVNGLRDPHTETQFLYGQDMCLSETILRAGFAITDSSSPYSVDKMRSEVQTTGPGRTIFLSAESCGSRKTFYLFLPIASLDEGSAGYFFRMPVFTRYWSVPSRLSGCRICRSP
ncbi:hypothetical protein J6590_046563 [Homalodisca vitripennis]|nr:hypothetical protein J6590_046563 [Homalodisca vitripennis]